MIYSTRFRLISSLIGMTVLVGGLSLIVGARLINSAVVSEATNRIRLDLNAAREIYVNHERKIDVGLSIAALQQDFSAALFHQDRECFEDRMAGIAKVLNLDFAGLVSSEGLTLCRLGSTETNRLANQVNPIAALALELKSAVKGTLILKREELLAENPALAERARIQLLPTAKAAPRPETEEDAGMTIAAAVPVYQGSLLLGVMYGGILLNRSTEIVDTVRETVFQKETYRGRSIGTATIFLKDLRISTNVLNADGIRAIGTRVSEEVNKKVLLEGERWTDRAFVVNDWYITAYEPVHDVKGNNVGILYVGVLEAKYADLQRNALLVFVLITMAGVIGAILIGFLLGTRILKPVHELIEASRKVLNGDLSPEIGTISRSEIGDLQRTFMEMLSALRQRDRRQRAESEHRLLQSEKQASVGRLAAGVAHEINNPLTGVLTFTHMLLRRKDLDSEMKTDLETIAKATERVREIVKGLLDFARQTKIEPEMTDINSLIDETLVLVENQALVKRIIFCFEAGLDIPLRTLDRNQFQSVLMNIIINAIDATESGGHINVATAITHSAQENRKGIEVSISDTGCGIDTDHLDKLFDPFFTTKEVGQGTGLGLSVSMGIVERHGGTISVKSQKGKGSTFVIWLPVEEQSV